MQGSNGTDPDSIQANKLCRHHNSATQAPTLATVSKPQFLYQEVVFDSLEFMVLRGRNCRRIRIINCRAASDGHLGQQIHIRVHATFVFQIVRILRDQIISLAHKFSLPFKHW